MAEELFRVEYDDDGRPTHMHVGKHGIRLSQEDAQRIFDKYFDMRDTVDIMREENAKLKAQNKRLRKECTSLRKTRELEFARSCEAATNSMGQIGTLRDKNAELRELAKDLYNRLNDSDKNCRECRNSCNYDAWNFGDPKCIYARRMRELGIKIEVD